MNVSELKSGFSIFGNKGNVQSETSHIYQSGKGNMCGTPALSNNWARIEDVNVIGCPECLKKYRENDITSIEQAKTFITGETTEMIIVKDSKEAAAWISQEVLDKGGDGGATYGPYTREDGTIFFEIYKGLGK